MTEVHKKSPYSLCRVTSNDITLKVSLWPKLGLRYLLINHCNQSQTLELKQGGLRDLFSVSCLMLGQSSLPLVCWGKNHHHPAPEASEQLQLVMPCREEDVTLDNREMTKRE